MNKHRLIAWFRFLACLFIVGECWACAPYLTKKDLHAMNPSAEIIDVCVRTPTVDDGTYAWGYRSARDETVSVTRRAAFEEFAPRAEVFYWYEPTAPNDSPQRLPWPYHHLQCTTQSGRAPSLPKEMTRVDLSYEAREALVSILTQQCAPAPEAREASAGVNGINKQFLGQLGTPISVSSRKTFTSEHVEEVTKTLKDALKGKINDLIDYGPLGPTAAKALMPPHLVVNAPKTTGQPMDSPAAQFVGGFISEVPAATVPGGALVTDALIATNAVPEGTREARLGKALADMGVGAGQTFIGVDATIIGGGATMTGGGAVVGVPMCVGGLALATNGVITFCNGTKNLVVVLYNWKADEVTAEVATQNQTPAATNPQQTSTQGAPPAPPPAAKPPPEPPPPAAKPAPKPVKPVAAPPEPPQPGPTLHMGRHYGSGKKTGPNSTTWVKCTGQVHHAISKEIHRELQEHKVLKDVYKARDNRFVTQAVDKAAHNGYDSWHRSYERQVNKWIKDNEHATPAEFEKYLFDLYKTDQEIVRRFPNGL